MLEWAQVRRRQHGHSAAPPPFDAPLPVPPADMRALVGPTDVAAFEDPSGGPVFPFLIPRCIDLCSISDAAAAESHDSSSSSRNAPNDIWASTSTQE